jgi:hypothetical protein
MGIRCPYPEIFADLRAAPTDSDPPPALPVDRHGACLFHSQEAAWKREQQFEARFRQLLSVLDTDEAIVLYDFAEFAFVGSGPGSTGIRAEHVVRIAGTTFAKAAYFTAAVFLDPVEIEDVEFSGGATFDRATFASELRIVSTHFRDLDFSGAVFAHRAFLRDVECRSFADFARARYTGTIGGSIVRFERVRFQGITDFSGAQFTVGPQSSVAFDHVRFDDVVDFTGTHFNSTVVFRDVAFASAADFIDTSFDPADTAGQHRGSPIEFIRIEVGARAVLTFMSTDPQDRMFKNDVEIRFDVDPVGLVRFQNVNFNRIARSSRDRLTQLVRTGRVEIGSGCIKYRHQTGVRTVFIGHGNAPLVVELCQTFTSYFTASNGLNLGFEIVERDRTKVSFFYFTDENVSEVDFLERLAQAERSLWNLLSTGPGEQALAGESVDAALSPGAQGGNVLIAAVDGMSALFGTLFRAGVRYALGAWTESDTRALLNTIRFNEEGAEHRVLGLHRALVERYTGQALFGFSRQQNDLLPPIGGAGTRLPSREKTRILFLGANSIQQPLDLEMEVGKIDMSLKLARERDNLELKQTSAVTTETLMQAMLDEAPSIVHFSGHGGVEGIILRDAVGDPKPVTAEALSSLFRLFADTVRCVVLNACYSEVQGRAIRRHIPYVIGMQSAIPDAAAVAFSTGFYKALGAGRSIPFAFDMGKASIELEDVPGENILILL